MRQVGPWGLALLISVLPAISVAMAQEPRGRACQPGDVLVVTRLDRLARSTSGANEIIPADRATPSPDDRFHHCTYSPEATGIEWDGSFWGEVTRCFFAPMNSS
jgi:hypothetical protein